MEAHTLASLAGGTLELDLCFSCHGIWFDPQENLKLSPAAVVELFRLLHAAPGRGASTTGAEDGLPALPFSVFAA